MSQANVDYVLKHNPEIKPDAVEICPNTIEVIDFSITEIAKVEIRQKYKIPLNKKVFIYGGNLGKPQGIDFLIKCIQSQKNNNEVFFLVVGNGTEYKKLESFFQQNPQDNFSLMKQLPKEEYDIMVSACDVGMIFLDHRFTIPNFPSRLLAYMQAAIPVLACTDSNTDIGNVIVNGNFGWWCESNNVEAFNEIIHQACKSDLISIGKKGYRYLKDYYSSEIAYWIIMRHFDNM